MVDPVNLNVPGLPYLLFAAVFFAVVAVLTGVLSPIELAIRRHDRPNTDGNDGNGKADRDGEDDGNSEDGGDDRGTGRFRGDETATLRTGRPTGPVQEEASAESDSTVELNSAAEPDSTMIYECRRCGTTLDAGDERCPRCEVSSIARYEIS